MPLLLINDYHAASLEKILTICCNKLRCLQPQTSSFVYSIIRQPNQPCNYITKCDWKINIKL